MEEIKKRAPKKEKVYTKLQSFLTKFTTLLVCDIKDMPANNIHRMRKQLRALDSEVLCGKASVMIKAVEEYALVNKKLPNHINNETLDQLALALAGHQLCLIFTNKDLGEITKITDQYKIEKQSKAGQISPVEIILPAGPTGMDASQVEYFQNLRIQTKVVRNQLDIIKDTKILVVGQKITLSEINLMIKFNIKPFKHKIDPLKIIMGGKMFDSGILSLNNEAMEKAVLKGISSIASFGLATGISNKASAPHSIANAFKNIMGLAIGTSVELKQVKLSDAPKKEAPKKEEKKEEKKAPKKKEPEPEPEDEDIGMGGLF